MAWGDEGVCAAGALYRGTQRWRRRRTMRNAYSTYLPGTLWLMVGGGVCVC